jgi:hypothetical protein
MGGGWQPVIRQGSHSPDTSWSGRPRMMGLQSYPLGECGDDHRTPPGSPRVHFLAAASLLSAGTLPQPQPCS